MPVQSTYKYLWSIKGILPPQTGADLAYHADSLPIYNLQALKADADHALSYRFHTYIVVTDLLLTPLECCHTTKNYLKNW